MAKAKSQQPASNWQEIFIKELARIPNVTAAAKKARITRGHAYYTREQDPAFAEAWDDALEQSVNNMEGEAYRRAVHGTLEPVFYMGRKVGSVRRYSDSLIMFLMRSHNPSKYKETVRNETTGPDGEPLTIRIEYVDAETP